MCRNSSIEFSLYEYRTTKMCQCQCMKFLHFISGSPQGGRENSTFLMFAMLSYNKKALLSPCFGNAKSPPQSTTPVPIVSGTGVRSFMFPFFILGGLLVKAEVAVVAGGLDVA